MKNRKLLLIAYSEAFISVLSYVLIMAISLLLFSIVKILNIDGVVLNETSIQLVVETLSAFFPFVLLIAISYQLAKRSNISNVIIISISLSIAIFVSAEAIIHSTLGIQTILDINSPILVLIVPLIVSTLLDLFYSDNKKFVHINVPLNSTMKFIFPVLCIYIFTVLVVYIANKTIHSSYLDIDFNLDLNMYVSNEILFLIRTIFEHVFWFFGIHGSNFFNAIFNIDFLSTSIFNNISYKQFYDLFVIYGGSGAGLSLLLAIFMVGKDQQSKKIAKLATPFVIFNINEVLIFGIPIIFNKTLFIPFLIVPLVNTTIAYAALYVYPLELIEENVSWVTPIFVNAYIVTDGNIFAIFLQLFLLMLGTAIYIPFVKKYTASQAIFYQKESLHKRLDLKAAINSKQELESYKAKSKIIESNKEVEKFIESIGIHDLMIYYQPKVNIETNKCNEYEALLRINEGDFVRGPYFLSYIEEAGLAPIIDLWVCKQVAEHISLWKEAGFIPEISVNLHPDSLADDDTILQVIGLFRGQNINIEIIERGLLDTKSAIDNIFLLKKEGFTIAIDDFGTGFSSFETLCTLPVDSLKIDKSLIDIILSKKGNIACSHIVSLCQAMGFTCIAEGVETKEQYEEVSKLNINCIQGYIYSEAMPFEQVINYMPKNLSSRIAPKVELEMYY